MDTVFKNWDPANGEAFGKAPFVAEHGLHEREMFSDDGLAHLLDIYPREAMGIHTMGDARAENGGFRKGVPGDLSGKALLDAVSTGRLWINLRKANEQLDDYAAITDELFGALEARVPGLKTMKRDCGVLISSPNAKVFYHLDIPLVTLWQIRGQKTFRVYPAGHPFVRDVDMEAIALGEQEEDIHYDPAFEDRSEAYTLTPGLMASWPQNAPHRIDNGDCLNVSLSCEFMTMPGLVRANAIYANGVLRRKFGADPAIERHGSLSRAGKALLARGFKAFNSRQSFLSTVEPSFVVDPTAPNAIRDLPAA